jgi:hypothetical protein
MASRHLRFDGRGRWFGFWAWNASRHAAWNAFFACAQLRVLTTWVSMLLQRAGTSGGAHRFSAGLCFVGWIRLVTRFRLVGGAER